MKENPSNFPLAWPAGFKRTPSYARKKASFGVVGRAMGNYKQQISVAEACKRLMKTMDAFTKVRQTFRIVLDDVIISTNLKPRLDGLPYSNQKEPEDVGVAVYFELDGKPKVLCCDKWDRIADNIAAIAATLEAMRGLERWGVTESERVFTGFAALPARAQAAFNCWEVLGIPQTLDVQRIKAAWRVKANIHHPDRSTGSHEAMARVNAAQEEALKFAEQHR